MDICSDPQLYGFSVCGQISCGLQSVPYVLKTAVCPLRSALAGRLSHLMLYHIITLLVIDAVGLWGDVGVVFLTALSFAQS